jgi:hypothetical protein
VWFYPAAVCETAASLFHLSLTVITSHGTYTYCPRVSLKVLSTWESHRGEGSVNRSLCDAYTRGSAVFPEPSHAAAGRPPGLHRCTPPAARRRVQSAVPLCAVNPRPMFPGFEHPRFRTGK